MTTATSAADRLGRRLPKDAYLVTVEELFALEPHDRVGIELLLSPSVGNGARGWMGVDWLLADHGGSASSLTSAPSALVVIARRTP